MEFNEMIGEQFSACNRDKKWFAPLQSALEGLTAKQASWKMGNDGHSVLQIVNHLIFWNNRYLQKFKGVESGKMQGDNSSTFESGNPVEDDLAWQLTVEKINAVMNEFETAILQCDKTKFEKMVSQENKSTWLSVLGNVNLHNAYHIGQIVLLRKIQESWDAGRNGVH